MYTFVWMCMYAHRSPLTCSSHLLSRSLSLSLSLSLSPSLPVSYSLPSSLPVAFGYTCTCAHILSQKENSFSLFLFLFLSFFLSHFLFLSLTLSLSLSVYLSSCSIFRLLSLSFAPFSSLFLAPSLSYSLACALSLLHAHAHTLIHARMHTLSLFLSRSPCLSLQVQLRNSWERAAQAQTLLEQHVAHLSRAIHEHEKVRQRDTHREIPTHSKVCFLFACVCVYRGI